MKNTKVTQIQPYSQNIYHKQLPLNYAFICLFWKFQNTFLRNDCLIQKSFDSELYFIRFEKESLIRTFYFLSLFHNSISKRKKLTFFFPLFQFFSNGAFYALIWREKKHKNRVSLRYLWCNGNYPCCNGIEFEKKLYFSNFFFLFQTFIRLCFALFDRLFCLFVFQLHICVFSACLNFFLFLGNSNFPFHGIERNSGIIQ